MLGVILFVLVLLVYGLILSRSMIKNMFPVKKDQDPVGMAKFLLELDEFFKNKGAKFIFSISALVIGIWNLFAPDFSSQQSAPVIGAIIPVLILILDGLIIDAEIIEFLKIPDETKQKYYAFIDKIKGFMGIATLASAILHLAFYNKFFL